MQILEINDLQLAWYDQAGARTVSPGAALIENDSVSYGEVALERSRLAPRGFQDQHWQLLNSDSLPVTAPGVMNNADLVFRHLQALLAQAGNPPGTEVLCAVPGSVTTEQLGLLLGIAQEAEISITSFVNSALLYALSEPLPAEAWCIDIHNRRGVLTRLNHTGPTLSATETVELPQLSMSGLVDGWLDQLTDQFVARSRFDPLRVAETEQQLFDQVRHYLADGSARQTPLSAKIDHQDNRRAVDLSFEELSGRAQQRYRMVLERLPARATVVLTPMADRLPAFANYLSGHGHTTISASATELWQNAENNPALQNPDAVHFVQQLTSDTGAVVEATTQQYATHALLNHEAIPLAVLAQTCAELAGNPEQGYQVAQGNPGVALQPGDPLIIADTQYLCIRVANGPAA